MILDTLVALGFAVILNTPNHIVAQRLLPEKNPWMTCAPPYYWFNSAGVRVDIEGDAIKADFWERREYKRHYVLRPCDSTGALEKALRQ